MYQGKFERKSKSSVSIAPASSKYRTTVSRSRGSHTGSIVFYTIFFLCVLLFCGASFFGLNELERWLTRYELAQPSAKASEVFIQLFAAHDWGTLYDLAQDSSYGSRDAFVNSMEGTVGSSALTFMETSTGLSGDKKYLIRLGKEKIAEFTLVNQSQGIAQTDIPDWELGTVTFFLKQEEISYRIQKLDGHTAYVNGTALDDSATIQISTMQAEDYLPVGVTGIRICTQEIIGSSTVPSVRIVDGNGNDMDVVYDEATHTFTEQTTERTMDDTQRSTALNAIKTYALYMMKQASRKDVTEYFVKGSDAYNAITGTELGFVQGAASFDFTNETVSDFCRYSDTLFSVRVSVTLNQHRKDGSVKESIIDQSLFFEKQSSDKWLCYAMTAEDVMKENQRVRLTFKNEDTVLQSDFYDTSITQLMCPVVTAPEGKHFSGWVTEGRNEEGETVMNLVFQPDESGKVFLSAGNTLGPMTLIPLFE